MDTTLRKVLLRCVDDAEISRDRRNQARPDDAISMQRLPSSRLQNLRHVGRDSLSELARLGVEGFELLVQRFEEADGFSSLDRCAAKRASANRRKMSPRTGWEYCAEVRPELARS